MGKLRLPLHTVIRFPLKIEGGRNSCITDYKYLADHSTWAVVRVDESNRSCEEVTVRLRSMDGKVAMTEWLCLYDKEYVIDPFLTAVYKAQKSVVK